MIGGVKTRILQIIVFSIILALSVDSGFMSAVTASPGLSETSGLLDLVPRSYVIAEKGTTEQIPDSLPFSGTASSPSAKKKLVRFESIVKCLSHGQTNNRHESRVELLLIEEAKTEGTLSLQDTVTAYVNQHQLEWATLF